MLEEEVAAAATAADESIMLTVAERNSGARIFYGNREYWIDTSSPGNFAEKAPYIIMRKYPNQDESKGERDARFWDHFYASQRSFRVFESDEQPYRELRAVEVFNTGSQVGRDMKVLKPSMQSACPHVLTNVATRQIVEMGDPLRRGCDQSESIGANMKSTKHDPPPRLSEQDRRQGAQAHAPRLGRRGPEDVDAAGAQGVARDAGLSQRVRA